MKTTVKALVLTALAAMALVGCSQTSGPASASPDRDGAFVAQITALVGHPIADPVALVAAAHSACEMTPGALAFYVAMAKDAGNTLVLNATTIEFTAYCSDRLSELSGG